MSATKKYSAGDRINITMDESCAIQLTTLRKILTNNCLKMGLRPSNDAVLVCFAIGVAYAAEMAGVVEVKKAA